MQKQGLFQLNSLPKTFFNTLHFIMFSHLQNIEKEHTNICDTSILGQKYDWLQSICDNFLFYLSNQIIKSSAIGNKIWLAMSKDIVEVDMGVDESMD